MPKIHPVFCACVCGGGGRCLFLFFFFGQRISIIIDGLPGFAEILKEKVTENTKNIFKKMTS